MNSQELYRGWDRAEIDRQLNLRERWPEHGEYFSRWARDSAAVRARLEVCPDLAYGDTSGQRLDLFPLPSAMPRPVAGAPLLVFIHGGYWQSLAKSDFSYLAPAFLEAGIAFAALESDLAPKVGIPEIVTQIRRAIAWLADHGDRYGIDRERLYVAGHSAGGHLAAMALSTDWRRAGEEFAGQPADLVKGACSISGVYDLEPLRLSYHQAVLKLDPGTARAMSPLHGIPHSAGNLICAVGATETEEFLRQQEEFVAAWRAAGLPARVVDLPGLNHFSALDALGNRDHPLFAAVRDLVLGKA